MKAIDHIEVSCESFRLYTHEKQATDTPTNDKVPPEVKDQLRQYINQNFAKSRVTINLVRRVLRQMGQSKYYPQAPSLVVYITGETIPKCTEEQRSMLRDMHVAYYDAFLHCPLSIRKRKSTLVNNYLAYKFYQMIGLMDRTRYIRMLKGPNVLRKHDVRLLTKRKPFANHTVTRGRCDGLSTTSEPRQRRRRRSREESHTGNGMTRFMNQNKRLTSKKKGSASLPFFVTKEQQGHKPFGPTDSHPLPAQPDILQKLTHALTQQEEEGEGRKQRWWRYDEAWDLHYAQQGDDQSQVSRLKTQTPRPLVKKGWRAPSDAATRRE